MVLYMYMYEFILCYIVSQLHAIFGATLSKPLKNGIVLHESLITVYMHAQHSSLDTVQNILMQGPLATLI